MIDQPLFPSVGNVFKILILEIIQMGSRIERGTTAFFTYIYILHI